VSSLVADGKTCDCVGRTGPRNGLSSFYFTRATSRSGQASCAGSFSSAGPSAIGSSFREVRCSNYARTDAAARRLGELRDDVHLLRGRQAPISTLQR